MRWPWQRRSATKPIEQAIAEQADAERIAAEALAAVDRAHLATTESRRIRRDNHFAETMRTLLEA